MAVLLQKFPALFFRRRLTGVIDYRNEARRCPLLANSRHLSCAAKARGLILLLRVTKGRVLVHEIRDGGLVPSAEAAFRGDTEPFDGR